MEFRTAKKLACTPGIFTLVCNAEKFSSPLLPGLSVSEWPWWIHRLVGYVGTVKSIYERSSIMDLDVPPRYIWWDHDELDAYFDRKKNK